MLKPFGLTGTVSSVVRNVGYRWTWAVMVIASLFFGGCQTHVNGIATPETKAHVSSLEGRWTFEDEHGTTTADLRYISDVELVGTISSIAKKSGKVEKENVTLTSVQLGSYWFLDVEMLNSKHKTKDGKQGTHVFLRLGVDGQDLIAWLVEPQMPEAEKSSDVVTSSTEALQLAIQIQHLNGKHHDDPIRFKRLGKPHAQEIDGKNIWSKAYRNLSYWTGFHGALREFDAEAARVFPIKDARSRSYFLTEAARKLDKTMREWSSIGVDEEVVKQVRATRDLIYELVEAIDPEK